MRALAVLTLLAAAMPAAALDPCLTQPCERAIHPGAALTDGCTMNFIFRDGGGARYLGLAGHCEAGQGATGARVGLLGVGEVATVVWDGGDGEPGTVDFALARIDADRLGLVDPTVHFWGGPEGLNGAPAAGQTAHTTGWGDVWALTPATRSRVGVVAAVDAGTLTYIGLAQPGDSGAPLLTGDGRAAGFHVASGLGAGGTHLEGPKLAVRLDAALAAARAATGLGLELVPGERPFALPP